MYSHLVRYVVWLLILADYTIGSMVTVVCYTMGSTVPMVMTLKGL
jgi:hypothetical protein